VTYISKVKDGSGFTYCLQLLINVE